MPIVEENVETQPISEGSVLEMYKSLSMDHRTEEEDLILRSIENGVVPHVLRYGIMKSVYRGVVQNGEGELFYFNYVPGKDFKLVKANDKTKAWDAERIIKKSKLGCDLIKAGVKKKDDEEEDEEKSAAGGTAGAAMAPVPEAQAVAQQNTLTTDVHPGAAGGGGRPDSSPERWHPDEAQKSNEIWTLGSLLKSMGQQLQATAPVPSRMPTDKEREFMVGVLGRSPDEVSAGRVQLSPTQRAHFNMWLNRSLSGKLDTLKTWLKKSNG